MRDEIVSYTVGNFPCNRVCLPVGHTYKVQKAYRRFCTSGCVDKVTADAAFMPNKTNISTMIRSPYFYFMCLYAFF